MRSEDSLRANWRWLWKNKAGQFWWFFFVSRLNAAMYKHNTFCRCCLYPSYMSCSVLWTIAEQAHVTFTSALGWKQALQNCSCQIVKTSGSLPKSCCFTFCTSKKPQFMNSFLTQRVKDSKTPVASGLQRGWKWPIEPVERSESEKSYWWWNYC